MIKYETFIIKTFDQLKNDNFDQVNFGQTTPCLSEQRPPVNNGLNFRVPRVAVVHRFDCNSEMDEVRKNFALRNYPNPNNIILTIAAYSLSEKYFS